MFTNRIALDGIDLVVVATNTDATAEPGEPPHAGSGPAHSQWWSWQAPYTGPARLVVTNDQRLRTRVAVYRGTTLATLEPIASDFSYWPRGKDEAVVDWDAVAGEEYQIVIDPIAALDIPHTLHLHLHTLVWVRPPAQSLLPGNQPTELVVTNTETDHPLTKVDYYADGTWIGQATEAPFSLMWTPQTAGHVEVVAVGQNSLGESRDTLPLKVTVSPGNDDFQNAFDLTGTQGTFESAIIGATGEPGEPSSAPATTNSIWWRWTAPASGDVEVTAVGREDFGVEGAVYIGERVDQLTEVVSPTVTSLGSETIRQTLTFRAWEGETYYFRFTGANPEVQGTLLGNYTLSVLPDIPANDLFARRIHLSGPTNVVVADNALASREPGEPEFVGCSFAGRTLWWTYSAPEKGTLHIAASASPVRPTLLVFEGDSLAALTQIAHSCQGEITLPMLAGQSIQVAYDTPPVPTDPYTLEWTFFPLPENDLFENAVELEGTHATLIGHTYAATVEPNETPACDDEVGHTVWYTWVAPETLKVTLDTGRYERFICLGIYEGNSLDQLTPVPALVRRSRSTFVGMKGRRYYIQIDSGAGQIGFAVELSAEPLPPTTNDDFEEATLMEGLWMEVPGSFADATLQPGEPDHWPGVAHKSIWYRWTAPVNAHYALYSTSLADEIVLAVYSGTNLEQLTLEARGTNVVQFMSPGGESWYFAVVARADVLAEQYVYVAAKAGVPYSIPVPGNLLGRPSFEGASPTDITPWERTGGGGSFNEGGGADGSTWLTFPAGESLWQDFDTIPGELYRVKFAYLPYRPRDVPKFRVLWDDQVLGVIEGHAGVNFWQWISFVTTATQARSRLKIEFLGDPTSVDAFSVVWVHQPPTIEEQPASVSALAGGAALFQVSAAGSLPLSYQWYHEGQPVVGATEPLLTLDPVEVSDAGVYTVVITNAYGAVTSAPAMLNVEAPDRPTFIVQPYGDSVVAGSYLVLTSLAAGAEPLAYQWYRDGEPVPEATGRHLIFTNIQPEHAGTYTVRVTNSIGTAWSLPAHVEVAEATHPPGLVRVWNLDLQPEPGYNGNTLVMDVDGLTPVAGDGFVAQLYAGPSLERMRPVGQPSPFMTGPHAGIWWPTFATVPSVASGETAIVQVRAWERTKGETYEEARALGGRFGKSNIFEITMGGGGNPPLPAAELNGLHGFTLQAGLPEFNVGRIDFVARENDGTMRWRLTGQAGFRYLIEKASAELIWRPFTILTNETGTVEFTDPEPPADASFYRSRILD